MFEKDRVVMRAYDDSRESASKMHMERYLKKLTSEFRQKLH
jgi:hypothetical protein